MITAWTSWRLVKFAALCLLVGGIAGTLTRSDRPGRIGITYGVVLPAFVAVWTAGYALMHESARGFEGWILAAMATSLLSLHLVLLAAHLARPRAITGALAVGALAVALAEMVLRPTDPAPHVAALAVGVLFTGVALPVLPAEPAGGDAEAVALRAVTWTGRSVGVSLLLLLGVSLGRRALGVDLGWGPALLGWVHGILVLVWAQVVLAAGRSLGWSAASVLFGFVALVPFGPLLYERWGPLRRR